MPRCVRNFWIDVYIDGYKHRIEAGPQNKEGGMIAKFSIREKGSISEHEVQVYCYSENGKNTIKVYFDRAFQHEITVDR